MAGSSRFPKNADLPIGAIIAGGEGRRLGVAAKPLTLLNGLTLMGHTINVLTPQVRGLVLGLRKPEPWADDFALPIVTDTLTDVGPAASIVAVLSHLQSETEFVITAPADCPFLPNDLIMRLQSALGVADVAVATSQGQQHHLIALWRTALAPELNTRVKSGIAAIHDLQSCFRTVDVDWPVTPHDPFFNINTPTDLTEAAVICSSQR